MVKTFVAGMDVGRFVVLIYTGLGGNVLIGGTGIVDTCGLVGIVVYNLYGNDVGTHGDGIITTVGLSGTTKTDVAGIDVGNLVIGIITGDGGNLLDDGNVIELNDGMTVGTLLIYVVGTFVGTHVGSTITLVVPGIK
jgi:hypothetical protein